jgi:uncharacterized protein DUF262/uncharacterized protein DUF1524
MPFTAQTIQVGQLLANPVAIEAPSYQRLFAWTEREAAKLLEDITAAPYADAAARSFEYFLGAMLFMERERTTSRFMGLQRTTRVLEVVDGLQRLTTLTTLFCVLRDLDDADDEPPNPRLLAAIGTGHGATVRYRLTIGGPDEAFFRDHVRAPGATHVNPESSDLSPTRRHILEVRDHFVTVLTGYDAADRRKLAEFLLDRCTVVQMTATDIDQAHRMFEVLNARGKPLARNDILKAELLSGVAEASKSAVTAVWESAEGCASTDFEQLFSHIRAMYPLSDGRVIAAIRQIAADTGGAQAFIERILLPSAAILDDIRRARHTGSPQSAAISRYLRYLGWHSFSDWKPPAILWWLENGKDAQGLLHFLGKLDRLAFGIRILAIGGSKRARRFGAVVSAIREGRSLDGPDSPLELTRQELRTIQHNLRDLHARNAPAAKHLLMRLSEHKARPQQHLPLPNDITVEHVLPRKLSAESPWRGWYPDPEEREQCTESLGNLVLVTKAQNDRAGNSSFARKLDIYFNTQGAPVPAINEDLRHLTEWKPSQIMAREAELMRLIEEVWNFDLARLRQPAPDQKSAKGRRGRRGPTEDRDRGPAP